MRGSFSALLVQAVPAPSTSPLLSMGYGWALIKLLGVLLVVCGLAYLVLRWMSGLLGGGAAPGGSLRVVERCPLTSRQSLWVVEASGRYFLIAGGDGPGGQITRLAELEQSAQPQPESPIPSRSFWSVLHRPARGPR